MNIARNFGEPEVVAHDKLQLEEILRQRDSRGGAQFWLSDTSNGFPCLLMVVSGDQSYVIYLPEEEHPGFRCLRPDDGQPAADGSTNFVWEGCDPFSGEQVPNRFVIPFSTALRAAHAFDRSLRLRAGISFSTALRAAHAFDDNRSLPDDFLWFEL